MKTIIQFPHPGGEHNAKSGVKWNTGNHKRKFLNIDGSYLKTLTSKPIKDSLFFWGEWEAPSNVISIIGNNVSPSKYIFKPFYTLPVPPNGANTDPFVFGGQFYYCICKQGHYQSLRNLNKGDIILFGSNLNKHFVLDTLFVVKDYFDYRMEVIENLKKKYHSAFYDVSLTPIIKSTQVPCKEIITDNNGNCLPAGGDNRFDCNPTIETKKYRIYRAVMYRDRKKFNGIFSYVPCVPGSIGNKGFARPKINLFGISQNLNQGLKIIKFIKADECWKKITEEVVEQNLNLMIKTDIPQKF